MRLFGIIKDFKGFKGFLMDSKEFCEIIRDYEGF